MLLNVWDDMWAGIGNGLLDFVVGLFTFIPKVLYFIISCLFSLVDLFQVVFRKLAGLDVIMISGEVTKGDPVFTIISDALFTNRYPAISTTFWSLMILGIIMLFATTFIAVIRVEMVPDKDSKNNSKEGIIRNFFKALFNFAIVPISCVFALFVGNAIVGVIDSALSANEVVDEEKLNKFDKWTWSDYDGGDLMREEVDKDSTYIAFDIFGYHIPTTMEPFSATMFKACATTCNRLNKSDGEGFLTELNDINALGIFDGTITESREAADLIDTGFMYNAKLKKTYELQYTDGIENYTSDWWSFLFGANTVSNFSRYNVTMVWYFYDLWTFNYIIGFAGLIIIVKLYWQFALALMARLFEITGLFLISPIPVAIMPLDGGGTQQRWRARFYSKFCIMVIMVLGLNLVNPLITLVKDIKLFNVAFLDYLALSFFIIAALNAIDSLNQTLSYILFDRFGEGEYGNAKKMADNIQGTFNQGLANTAKTAGFVASVPLKAGAAGVGGITNAFYKGHQSKKEGKEISKNIKFDDDAKDKQEKQYQALSTKDKQAEFNNYVKTQAGQELMDKFDGADEATKMANMEKALVHGDYSGKKLGETEKDINDNFYKDRHDENLFKHSDLSKGLKEGTTEYSDALEKFKGADEKYKVKHIRKGEQALTTAQQEIRDKRAAGAYDKPKKFFNKVGSGIGKVLVPIDKHIGQPIKNTFGSLLTPFGSLFGINPKKNDGKK